LPLPDDYTTYPKRSRGMDQSLYGWDPLPGRQKAELKSSARAVAVIVVPCAFFPLDPPTEPFRHASGMKTPYPDLRHYTVRDYGNRVGVFRILRELSAAKLRATFCVDAMTARRYPPLLEAIAAGGHEIAAHGVSSAHIHHAGLGDEEERALVARTRGAFPDASTWLSPARNESFSTPALLAEAGFTVTLDWEADNRPLPLSTEKGPVTAIPHYNELSDELLLGARSQTEDEWYRQLMTAADDHVSRYREEGATAFAFTLTPYIAGQPFRITALRKILSSLAAMDRLDILTAKACAHAFGAED
jgi:peptidoglycan/xylan/chitin deacetylase (PgdA/CDA1 family)